MNKNVGSDENVIVKKRGRKSKKEIEEAQKNAKLEKGETECQINHENISVNIEENTGFSSKTGETSLIDEIIQSDDDENNNSNPQSPNDKPIAKKRGRKPKGGKIIQQVVPLTNAKEPKPNIILHLKCSLKDLNSSNLFGSTLDGYSFTDNNNQISLKYDVINNQNNFKIF